MKPEESVQSLILSLASSLRKTAETKCVDPAVARTNVGKAFLIAYWIASHAGMTESNDILDFGEEYLRVDDRSEWCEFSLREENVERKEKLEFAKLDFEHICNRANKVGKEIS